MNFSNHARSLLLLLGAVTLGIGNLSAAIDFTPVVGERELDGVVFKHLTFREKDQQITYEHPAGWSYFGSANGLRLTPPGLAQSFATIEQTILAAPAPLTAETIELLRNQQLAKAAAGGQQVEVVAEEQNAIRINQADTYSLTFSYMLHGQKFTENVMFAHFGDTQLRFRVIATSAEFDKVFSAFRGSLFTLRWQ